MAAKINIDTIESKQFSIKPRGYDREEVDVFLDEICDELERMNTEMARLQKVADNARAAADRAGAGAGSAEPASETDVVNVLTLANRLKDETVAAAQKKAEEILADADAQARQRLGNLDAERDSLTRQVAALKQTAEDYRQKFNALIKAQQDALERISEL